MSETDVKNQAVAGQDTAAPPAEPDPVARLEQLQAENEALKAKLEALEAAREGNEADQAERERLERENAHLREKVAAVALNEAIAEACEVLGLDAGYATLAYKGKFRCEIGSDGQPIITPNVHETLAKLAREDRFLRAEAIAEAREAKRRADSSIQAALAGDGEAAVKVVGYLERNARDRHAFVRQHGAAKYFELLALARRHGWRRERR